MGLTDGRPPLLVSRSCREHTAFDAVRDRAHDSPEALVRGVVDDSADEPERLALAHEPVVRLDLIGSRERLTGSGGVDRIYDDGYVKVDANGNQDGLTWNWGYQNSTQTNSAQQLLFHAAQDYTASGNNSVNSDAQVGFERAYGGHLSRWGYALVGWEFGFGYLPISIDDNRTITGVSATRRRT